MDKPIPESDSNELKTAAAANASESAPAPDDNAATVNPASDNGGKAVDAPIFDPFGTVTPADRTEGATPPPANSEPEKRGRGRPSNASKGLPPKKKSGTKKSAEAETQAAATVAAANAQVVVMALDLLRAGVSNGECGQAAPELRNATCAAWEQYLGEQGKELPPWVLVCVMSTAYIAPALATPTAKTRLSSLWAKARAWWIMRKGAKKND